jgi:hypothetical protein
MAQVYGENWRAAATKSGEDGAMCWRASSYLGNVRLKLFSSMLSFSFSFQATKQRATEKT